MKADNSNILVTTKEIAQLFGVTVRRIQQLVQDGVLNTTKVGSNTRFNLYETIAAYVAYLQEKAYGREAKERSLLGEQELREAKLAAEVKLKKAQGDKAELELKELAGKLYRAEDIEKLTNELVYTIRAMCLALPGRLCVDLASIDTPPEVNRYITKVINEMLQDLSHHEYSQARYLELIREREGYHGAEQDDDEDEEDEEDED